MSAAARMCFQFQKNGKCTYGSECKFAHGENDPKHKENHPKNHAAPAETVNAAPGAKATATAEPTAGGSGTGGTGSPVKEKASNRERRSDSPAAVDGKY